MKTFFRDEMLVVKGETIPSHQKTFRLLNRLKLERRLELVSDFPLIPMNNWAGIHHPAYLESVFAADAEIFGSASVPASDSMVAAIAFCAASLVSATFSALECGCAFSPSFGFHHAHWASSGTFCLLNALPLAAKLALTRESVDRILILDCDYHRGNGTSDILAHLNQERIVHSSFGYKFTRPAQARAYLQELESVCKSIECGAFDLVIYQAGMDALVGDPAGGGILTLEELRTRDAYVFSACRNGQVPIVWNLAGGYQVPDVNGVDVVVDGHLNTYDCAIEHLG